MSSLPIADHALLSDCHSAALVSRAGSVEWLCMPRFDSPSVFARLLDPDGGHWSITPALVGEDGTEVTRRYVDQTMVLETTFRTPGGTVVLVDALVFGEGERGHQLGASSPHLLVRHATCTEGAVELDLDWAPRTEYGRVHPLLREVEGGVQARGGADQLGLSSPVPLDLDLDAARATAHFELEAGQTATFAMHHRTTSQEAPRCWPAREALRRLDDTVSAWRSWAELHQSYEGPWKDLVHHSGRVMQALTYQPTGAIVAAPTTSLPESPGGDRNWDYRYAWVRDASFTAEALWVAACPDEAGDFFDYMAGAAAGSVHQGLELQIMFGVGGERDLTERELEHFEGWCGSRPVRVGNAAWRQRQLDVYGELLGAAARLEEQLPDLDEATARFFVALADAAADRWRDPDAGIWEVRGEPRHFVYSKLMCWVALRRAVELADLLGAADRTDGWSKTAEEIADAILTEGWSDEAGAFTQSFGSDDLDASSLMVAITGLLPPDDPRVLATIDAVEEGLSDERGLVYRYRSDDGLEGKEGTFLLCTFWLAQALAVVGRPERARAAFERAVSHANDVGLLAEEVDSATGDLLGNFPQAFSHIGLVNAAYAISLAEAEVTDQ